jgi:DNA modification methylase
MVENRILTGDSLHILKTLPDNSVDCCVTSPPYYLLRDYDGIEGQIGIEETPEKYIDKLLSIFHEVHRVLKDGGTLWVNIADTYNGSGKNNVNSKPLSPLQLSNTASHSVKRTEIEGLQAKSLIGIPWRFALAMQNEWLVRQDIIWAKKNPMPEPCKDRFCKSHEYIFLFSKQQKYYFNHDQALEEAVGYDGRGINSMYENQDYLVTTEHHEPGSKRLRWPQRGYMSKPGETGLIPQHHGENIPTMPLRTKRDVWFISTEASYENHYAMFPQALITPCILCGCPENGIVLDPFMGSGTTAIVVMKLLRKYIGCEINPEYVRIAERRIAENKGLWN